MRKQNEDNINGKRQEYRLIDRATVYIEVVAESYDQSEPAEILISNSVDVSANGLQITTSEPLSVNAIHQAVIQLQDTEQRTQLTVQVRWVRTNATEDEYYIGLAVLDDSDSAVAQWKNILSEKLINQVETD